VHAVPERVVLLDHRGAARDALLGWGRAAGAVGSDAELEEHWKRLETEHYRRFQSGELTKLEQRRARVRGFLAHRAELVDDDEAADAAFAGYWDGYVSAWREFPDALDLVRRALAAGRTVALLTNGDARDQALKVARTGLAAFDLPLLASSELGAAKPDPRAFATALARLDARPEDAVMVGDSVANDVEGALAAGVRPVLLDRYAAHVGWAAEHGVARVSGLEELELSSRRG
jgi:putative hydrolase of the HAD superfamily